MPGRRIKDLTALSGAGSANNDDVVIFDTNADTTKRISRSQLAEGMVPDLPLQYYLGTLNSNPTQRLNGDALMLGDYYLDAVTKYTTIYNGSGWNSYASVIAVQTASEAARDAAIAARNAAQLAETNAETAETNAELAEVNAEVAQAAAEVARTEAESARDTAIFRVPGVYDQIKSRLLTQRVDFVGLGDSNQLYGNTGWDQGFHVTLNSIAPTFATGLITMYENNGSGGGSGYGYSALRIGQTFAITGAAADVQRWLDKGAGNLGPMDPAYLDTGTASGTAQLGINVDASWYGDLSADLRYDLYTVSFDSGTGQFRLFHRLNDNTMQERGPTVLTNTGVLGNIVKTSLTRAARTRPTIVTQFMMGQLGYVDAGATPIIGPFFNTYQRVIVPSQTTGWSYSTLYGVGGQSMRDCAYALQQANNSTLTHYFKILRDDQIEAGATNPMVVITVNFGINDRNETLPSVGPAAVSDGDSPEAYVDNFTAAKQRIEQIWTLNGWSVSELQYLVFPSHPISNPDDAELISYRSAILGYLLTQRRTQYVSIESLINSTQISAAGYYAIDGNAHLTSDGYNVISNLVFGQVS